MNDQVRPRLNVADAPSTEAQKPKVMSFSDLQDLFSYALQGDLEHGVSWLNERASKEFSEDYPRLVAAINTLFGLEEINPSKLEET